MQSKPEYIEKFLVADGKSSKTLGGYARLTASYRAKRVRDKPREVQNDNIPFYNHLRVRHRISAFLTTKKKRLLMILAAIISFNFTGNMIGLVMAKIERKYKSYKFQKILQMCPEVVMYQTAIDTSYNVTGLSTQSTNNLS